MNRCLLKKDFVMRKVSAFCRHVLQFISQCLWVFFLMVVDGIQGSFIALLLKIGFLPFPQSINVWSVDNG